MHICVTEVSSDKASACTYNTCTITYTTNRRILYAYTCQYVLTCPRVYCKMHTCRVSVLPHSHSMPLHLLLLFQLHRQLVLLLLLLMQGQAPVHRVQSACQTRSFCLPRSHRLCCATFRENRHERNLVQDCAKNNCAITASQSLLVQ